MFFEGTLQEGISSALQQSKFVVCFVTDDQGESQQWESEFLADDSLNTLLTDRAVSLRLQAGSTEAGYLAAIFPLPKTPTLVIIKNGNLQEYIASGVSKEDFVTRTRNALVATSAASGPAPPVTGATGSQGESSAQSTSNASTDSSGQATPSSAAEPESSTPQSLLAERAVRVEAQQKKAAEEARSRAKAKAEAKAAEVERTGVPDPQSKHADMLKKKRKEAREEKERILQAIEDDKAARKARQAEREAERRMSLEAQKEEALAHGAPAPAPAAKLRPATRASEHCALQVRLFDGSTIRNRFPSGNRLGTDVRNWVDASRGDDKQAYAFKVVLTPLPNKTVETSEEGQSLQDLGLTPSSTLILVPVAKSIAAAYPTNPVLRLIAFIMACITGFFGGIVNFFATMFSTSGPVGQPEPAAVSLGGAMASGRDGGRRQEIRDRRNDQQFYNGNSTNFEPRRDDDDDDE